MRRRTPLALVTALLGLAWLGATPAAAQSTDDCPTWLPDFHCDRSGRWEGFQKPIVQPFLFEDPFITTGLYAYYIWHEFPRNSALGGGHADAVALQARVALTDRLAFIATKDGYVWEYPDSPLLSDKRGWMNLVGGLKYALIERPEDRFILSPVLRIEVPTGSQDIFEGGSGVILIPSVSAAWGPSEKLQLIGDVGSHIPFDGRNHSSTIFYHLYADYQVDPHFQPFLQLSGIYYVESGDGNRRVRLRSGAEVPISAVEDLVGSFEGVDFHNLGSSGVDNNDYVTLAIGSHVPINRHVTFSIAYERPISSRKDITKQRVTTSLRLEF